MASSPTVRRALVLPMVLFVCALMVLPASAVLETHNPAAPAAQAATSVAARPSTPVAPTYEPPSGSSLPLVNQLSPADLGRFAGSGASFPSAPSLPSSSFGTTLSGTAPWGSSSTKLGAQPNVLSSLSVADRVASLVHSGVVPARVAYYPNLNLLTHPITIPSQIVAPTYQVSPAPMGIADFGLGATAYNLTTSGVQGALSLAGYNATAGTLYQDTAAYYWDGLSPNREVTPYQSGIQLNSVLTNVSYPGSDTGVFWTQNIVQFSASTLQFIDNVWNFSAPGAAMDPGTLYSYNGTLVPYDFYYAYGPTLPLTFPMTMELYSNASNVNGRTTLTFGYRVTEGTKVYKGVFDTVVFNSLSSPPLLTPQFMINGQAATPFGLLYDAELVFGGPGGGSNSVINFLNGSMTLRYEHGSGWMPAPSAYDYGADTGETAIGLAGWWGGSTEYVNQGPSMLYGLWNASAGMLSSSGDVGIAFPFSPTYALAFIGPVGAAWDNLSYAPTAINGTMYTWLPPAIDGSYEYELTVFADAFSQDSFYFVSGIGGFTLPLSLVSSPGTWNAPVYMNGEAQATALAQYTTGWSSGPFVFSNIAVDVNLSFNHLNDWGFPEFDLFWANGVSTAIFLNDTVQGPNSPNGTTGYYAEVPSGWENLPDYGSEIAIWNSGYVSLQNLTLVGYELPIGIATGGAVSLWSDEYAFAANITSLYDSFGVWAADTQVTMLYSVAAFGAVGLTIVDSEYGYASNVSAYVDSAAVVSWGGSFGYFEYVNATYGCDGFYGFAANFTEISNVNASWYSIGAYTDLSSYVEVEDALASLSSYGAYFADSVEVGALDVLAFNSSLGVYAEYTDLADLSGIWAFNDSQAVDLYELDNSTVEGVYVFNDSYAIGGAYLFHDQFVNTSVGAWPGTVSNGSEGGEILFADQMEIENLMVNDSEGLFVVESNATQAFGVSATNDSLGLLLIYNTNSSATGIYANASLGLGVSGYIETALYVTSVTAVSGGIGVEALQAYGVEVANVTANGTGGPRTIGVYFVDSEFLSAEDVEATHGATGVNLTDTGFSAVADVVAESGALGVAIVNGSAFVIVQDVVSVDHASVGVGIASAFVVEVLHVTASDALGVVALHSSNLYVEYLNATEDADGFEAVNSTYAYVGGTNATLGADGVILEHSSDVWVTGTNVSSRAVGVLAEFSQDLYVQYTNVSGPAVGVGLLLTNDSWVNHTSAIDDASAVVLLGTFGVHVDGVTATSPFLYGVPWPYSVVPFGAPDAAIILVGTNRTTVSNVAVTDYPVALWDDGSLDLSVSGFTASGGDFGAMLNGTIYGLFYGLTLTGNGIGLQMNAGAFGNLVTTSTFQANTGYGLDIESGEENLVYDNSFVANNGANATYNPLTIQAFSASPSNAFNSSEKIGNYWADWHTYANGVLAPYYISNGAWDYHPLGAPEGMTVVTFNETGLPMGTSWSVTLNGSTETSTSSSITFDEYPGTYAFSIGAITGWQISPSSGDVVVGSSATSVAIGFSALYPVRFTESGLPTATTWTVVLNGVEQNVSGSSATFEVTAGTYSFSVLAPPGWAVTPTSGSIVVGAAYVVPLTFSSTVPTLYSVTVTETGLASGTSWSAVFNGIEETTTGSSLTFVTAAGTYTYQVLPVDGYTASVTTSSVVVSGNQSVAVTFTAVAPPPTYTVYVNETGLPTGTSWSAVFNGVEKTTSGSSLAFTVPAGAYTYQILSVAGYTASVTSGSVTVSASQSVAVTFTAIAPPPTYTVTVTETGLASGTSWSVVFNGVEETGTGTSLTFTVGAGTYTYQVLSVAGYTASVTSGSLTVSGNQPLAVVFTAEAPPPAYTVYFNETGLSPATSWSVVFNGVEKSTAGTSLSFTVAAGTYTYQILPPDGYTVSATSGSVVISGNQAVAVTFAPAAAPPSAPAYVEKSTFNWEYGLALAIAVLAVVLALVALLRRPRAPKPAVPWKEGTEDHETAATSPPGGASRP